VNKPRGSECTPAGAWNTKKLVRMGMGLRNTFDDVVLLREVHRFTHARGDLSVEMQRKFTEDALEFLRVTKAVATGTLTKLQHQWLKRRQRSVLQQTDAGRAELARFDRESAPLLMDGKKDRVTGERGAITVNHVLLEELSARTGKPIATLCAYHDKPDTVEGQKMAPEKMHDDDFRGMPAHLRFCEGARVLLTQNLWVEAGLMNGALGTLVGYMWPEGGDPHSTDKEKRSPLCVFVEFDNINLVDKSGVAMVSFLLIQCGGIGCRSSGKKFRPVLRSM
jgi:hypothetical protein